MEAWIYLGAALLWAAATAGIIWRLTTLKKEDDFPNAKDSDGRKF